MGKCQGGLFRVLARSSLCEPVLWSYWLHCGDCSAAIGAITLELVVSDLEEMIMCYPVMAEWGRTHATRFVAELNHRTPSDLCDTELLLSRPCEMRSTLSCQSNISIQTHSDQG